MNAPGAVEHWRLLAHALTGARLAAAPVFVASVWSAHYGAPGRGWVAALLFAFAAASDIVDGRWARRAGGSGAWARWFDHGADLGFVVPALGVYTAVGVVPWWVPASVLFAFAAYVVRSWSEIPPTGLGFADRIGHWGGVANYVLVGVLVVDCTLNVRWLPELGLQALFMLVPVYSTAPLWLPWLIHARRTQISRG